MVGANLQQLAPLHHPQLDELLTRQQLIDQLFALGRIGVGHELLGFGGRRQHAANIEAHAANELRIAAQLGGLNPQPLQLVVDQLVDVIVGRHFLPLKLEPFGSTMNGTPTVCFSKRAMMKASPRLAAVTLPSFETAAALSLLDRNTARLVTSRSVPSEYFARTVSCCVSPAPSSSAVGG